MRLESNTLPIVQRFSRTSGSVFPNEQDPHLAMSASVTQAQQQPQEIALNVSAILLTALAVFLSIALLTQSPADPISEPIWPLGALYTPDQLVYPTAGHISNACGYWGALSSSWMMSSLGLSSFAVIATALTVAFKIFFRKPVQAVFMRSIGACIALVALASALALLPIQTANTPLVGAGGVLGGMTSAWLLEHFNVSGAWILTLTMAVVGVLLTTDYAVLAMGRKFAQRTRASRQGMANAAKTIVLRRRNRKPFDNEAGPFGDQAVSDEATDESDPESDEDSGALRIKFPGKRSSQNDDGQEATGEPLETDDDYQEHSASDEDDYAIEAGTTRDVSVEGEDVSLRQEDGHDVPEPKVRVPKRKTKQAAKEEELNNLYDEVIEEAPFGSENYHLPSLHLLNGSDEVDYEEQLTEVRRKAKVLESTFADFGFNIRVVEIETGPVIAQYEIELEAGLRLSKITGLSDDLAIALRVPSVRIVAPIPGKNTVGIEVPNEKRQAVRLRDVMEEADSASNGMNIPVFLGKDVSGNPMVVDLAKMPHLLIAGRTGTGKSVCLNAIIASILMTCRPDQVRMLMIDPKMVELSGYGKLPHLMHPVITDMRKAEAILAWAVEKMEERYSLLASVGVRHINSYNNLSRDELKRRLDIDAEADDSSIPESLPFIVIVADEMADLMMTAGKDVEQHIIRLAQKSRAVGIHLILATQKPTVDVITGLIKSNLPARLSFQVASKTDSRVVLDENGADKLLGSGDMLFLWPGTSTLIRGQGTFLSDEEIESVCDHCSVGEQHFVGELINLKVSDPEGDGSAASSSEKRPDIYESAVEVIIREGRGSCSLLQRHLGIGYGRAAKLIDYMAEDGIVGQYNGSKAREVLLSMSQWEEMQGIESDDDEEEDDEPQAIVPRRTETTHGMKPTATPTNSPAESLTPPDSAVLTVTAQDDDEVDDSDHHDAGKAGYQNSSYPSDEEDLYEDIEYADETEYADTEEEV